MDVSRASQVHGVKSQEGVCFDGNGGVQECRLSCRGFDGDDGSVLAGGDGDGAGGRLWLIAQTRQSVRKKTGTASQR